MIVGNYIKRKLSEGFIGGTVGGIAGSFVGRSFIGTSIYTAIGGSIGEWLESYIRYTLANSIKSCENISNVQIRKRCYIKVYTKSIQDLQRKESECNRSKNEKLCKQRISNLIKRFKNRIYKLNTFGIDDSEKDKNNNEAV